MQHVAPDNTDIKIGMCFINLQIKTKRNMGSGGILWSPGTSPH